MFGKLRIPSTTGRASAWWNRIVRNSSDCRKVQTLIAASRSAAALFTTSGECGIIINAPAPRLEASVTGGIATPQSSFGIYSCNFT
ncbi:hypothetical protein D3C81_1773700 [compost metagenome]